MHIVFWHDRLYSHLLLYFILSLVLKVLYYQTTRTALWACRGNNFVGLLMEFRFNKGLLKETFCSKEEAFNELDSQNVLFMLKSFGRPLHLPSAILCTTKV